MKPLRQVDIGMPILLISFEKFTFNQMFNLAFDLRGLRLEQSALPENLLQKSVMLQPVSGFHDPDDGCINDMLPFHWGLSQGCGLSSLFLFF